MTPWPAWVSSAVGLACSIVICAGILAIGRLYDVPHTRPVFTESTAMGDGLRWCFNGIFGNGCWR
jgi:hypothetical protein